MKVQINSKFQEADTAFRLNNKGLVLFTPPIDEDYWLFRVPLSDKQAVVGFPKFFTIGIGFQVEGYDWNTNLPYNCEPEEILKHILCNKGDDSIPDEKVLEAIKAIQKQARLLKEGEGKS